jgi:membrane-associated phospholipid phosphatase
MTAVRSARIAAAVAAILALALFLLLGRHVMRFGEPGTLIDLEHAWLNHSSLIAWWLTWMGYAYVLVPACLALIAVAWRYPQWRPRVAFGIAVLLASWLGADFFQHFFARPRRLDWVVKHETAFSYPSSHAAVAVGFYMLWGEIVRRSELPAAVRWYVPPLLDLLALGILWSRLALGAHYVTDLLGGALWAMVVIAAGLAAASTKVLSPPQGRP